MPPRIGLGSDQHRLVKGTGLRLAGVDIPCDLRAEAHSDGDAVLHAVTDAILGAIAAGDIGDHFPDNDPLHRNRDSVDFLRTALKWMGDFGYRVGNVDVIVFLQMPKLAPYKDAMRKRLAEDCACDVGTVSIKAKTGEGLGPVGEGKLISVQAAVLLVESP